MCGRSFLISSNSYLNLWIHGQNSTDNWRTTRYDDGQSPRNKASKIQKLAFRCFLLTSAKAKKFQDGDRSIRLYTTISLQLFFFKNRHNWLSEGLTLFPAMGSKRSETKHYRRLQKPFLFPETVYQGNALVCPGIDTPMQVILFILRPSLEYGSEVWGCTSTQSKALDSVLLGACKKNL